ncbi:low temperature requirement protein A [Humibacter antri]
MTSQPSRAPGRINRIASRVSTLELLFDLVFVYAVSQVAQAILAHPTVVVAIQAFITVGVMWWMYDAYSWLTNQAAEQTAFTRVMLIVAMAAFLVMSLSLTDAWGADGVLFGVCYLVVVIIHAGLFIGRGGSSAVRTMLRVGPLNLMAALSLLASGFIVGPLDWVFFLLPYVFFAISALITRRIGLALGPEHFVERHGAVMIIVFGESIVSVGSGLTRHTLDPAVIVGALVTVATIASLWWCYFTGDDERAVLAMEDASPQRRATIGIVAYYLEHLVMIVGLIYLASGLHGALEDAFAVAQPAYVWLISAGVAVYVLGEAAYRRTLRLGPIGWRVAGAAAVLASAVVGYVAPVVVLLVVVLAIVVLMLVAERAAAVRTRAQSIS